MSAALSPSLLLGTTSAILEDAAFFFSERTDTPLPWAGQLLEAKLSFIGPRKGTMRLVTTTAFGVELAANLLGLAPSDADAAAHARAAVGELLNMVCGAFVAEWFGADQVCQLGIPVVRAIPHPDDAPGDCSICLIADERHRVEVEIILDEVPRP